MRLILRFIFTKTNIPSDFNRMAMCKLKLVKWIHKQLGYLHSEKRGKIFVVS